MNKKNSSLRAILLVVAVFSGLITFSQTSVKENKNVLAFIDARIYPSPTAAVIPQGTVLTRNEKIIAVGKKGDVKIPAGATVIDCKGLTITAGFWNSHVHFTDPKIAQAGELSDSQLSDYLENFTTKYGFTSVFDIGSYPGNTGIIKRRIAADSVAGPHILTTGLPLVPENGTPFYVKALHIALPELANAAMATDIVNKNLSSGLDGVKIFAGSPVEVGQPEKIMPLEIAKAVTAAAHKRNKPVFAHPSVNDGAQVAINAGVDVLAHTTPDGGRSWDSTMLHQLVSKNIYLTPTLKLWKWSLQNNNQSQATIDAFVNVAIGQVSAYKKAGGHILFGTDLGFIDDFDPTDEYIYLQQAGLSFRELLATLTTTPSDKFGFSHQLGRVAKNMQADLVIFEGDPEREIKSLVKVKYTVRKGRIIYKKI